MKARWILLTVVLAGLVVAAPPSVGADPPTSIDTSGNRSNDLSGPGKSGDISFYLAGTWDNRSLVPSGGDGCVGECVSTGIHMANPTPKDLWAFVTFWNDQESGLQCTPVFVSANGYADVITDIGTIGPGPGGATGDHGAVFVITTNTTSPGALLQRGVVAYRQTFRPALVDIVPPGDPYFFNNTEVRLQPVPTRDLLSDIGGTNLQRIVDLCYP